MHFLALAADYDGTIAKDGIVAPATLAALERLKSTGRRLILVTGRELPELLPIFPGIGVFDRVVAENGALIFDPLSGQERLLAPPPSAAFIERLKALEVEPLSVGRGIVATWEPCQGKVLRAIQELGLELQIVFNKGAVMVLPTGVNKASGLSAALHELDISRLNVVAVGDAENDHAFLQACGCAAAVANALPAVKAAADICLRGDHGAGIVELVERIIREDAKLASPRNAGIRLGRGSGGEAIDLQSTDGSVLIVGPSGSGKSTLATALTEHMAEQNFEFCILDPEGDYVDLQHAVPIGSPGVPPRADEALKLLNETGVSIVINTQMLNLEERCRVFASVLLQTSRLRQRTGRPHWLIIDEAHQVLPACCPVTDLLSGDDIPTAILLTLFPNSLAIEALRQVTTVIVLDGSPEHAIKAFAESTGRPVPERIPAPRTGEALYWSLRSGILEHVILEVPVQTHKRHAGKYAVGDVGHWHSFYFRGPDLAVNLRAPNLFRFIEIGDSVDDATWNHHLRAGDYSSWFRKVIKDEGLAAAAARIEADPTLDAAESRRRMRKAIWRRYAAPVS
ncbi:hypothetical protein FHS85_001139 [Rhodoligotrophos appendicifer]|uniref:HAD-IIB family hydrolase n=1 Tax=Rhodoligotrophos appendicifer TaxID=987056 RepID=UPI001185CF7E|nr:HAD-IIB family hydrolase [Rhodoligotrophos appendicifer]